MAGHTRPVNLDAMIPRADFALEETAAATTNASFHSISAKDLKPDGLIRPILRKPDFQRETNHWSPDQVVSLLECFVNGDLIPSVIVWRSPTYLFVIDGGHRLSAIRAWVEDDYGDGPVSRAFFGEAISKEQKRTAAKTRALIAEKIGTWQHIQSSLDNQALEEKERRRIYPVVSRAIPVQWVEGNAEKAEASFFKINTQGTALDDIEELLLANRRKPITIASRAVIRAGMGHRYWSKFASPRCTEIEELAKRLHGTLFQPEVEAPIKTLDLPLGGPTGVRAALQILIDFALVANRDQEGKPKSLKDQMDDDDGETTKSALSRMLNLACWMTGNDKGSLGLHPAIYFYGPTGRHLGPMFLGTALLISRKLINNDKLFFPRFSKVRSRLESILIEHKDLIATVLQKTISHSRVTNYAELLDTLISKLDSDESAKISESDIVTYAGLSGKIITGAVIGGGEKFSEETKSAVFITAALKSAIRCPICQGYLDPSKSVSYDHVIEKATGGRNGQENCQLTHPYCNQAVKNKEFQAVSKSDACPVIAVT
jgi:hypothetical protein